MGTKNTEDVRCINKATGKVKFFRKWFAHDKNWQKSTGFVPEELPKMNAISDKPTYINPPYDKMDQDFDDGLITTESDEPEAITEQETKEPQTKPASKATAKKAAKSK